MKVMFSKFMVCGLGLLAGCSTLTPDQERMLFHHDMLQAKLLIVADDPEQLPLAQALLQRSMDQDVSGEVSFYRAVLMARMEGPAADRETITRLLERAAVKGYPLANALLYKIYAEPYLISVSDLHKAYFYRGEYEKQPVASSQGYPSFDRALSVVNDLLRKPPVSIDDSVSRR